ncbi:MAG: hypothetical protein LHW44_07750 [Candidatus Cloacimonetes bacterium]|nr:hypothetical protein [Candidatus Cloacimonadota bacterium]
MKKVFKALLVVGGTALAAHFGFKAYKRISGIAKLSKSLPEFLNNVFGEVPRVAINRSLNTIAIRIGYSQEIIDTHDDIESTVREYIDDFYPDLAKCAIDIDVYDPGMDEDMDEYEDEMEEDEPETDD